jgi:hypothetical protein
METGTKILELSKNAARLYDLATLDEKRQLLGFVLSNSSWKRGVLTPEYRKPFDLFADLPKAPNNKTAYSSEEMGGSDDWLPGLDSNQQPFD